MRFSASDGQMRTAAVVCLARRRSSASRLSRAPRMVGNRGIVLIAGAFTKPGAQDGGGGAGEWSDALLSSFAKAADVRTRAEVNVAAAEPGELGCAQPSLDG